MSLHGRECPNFDVDCTLESRGEFNPQAWGFKYFSRIRSWRGCLATWPWGQTSGSNASSSICGLSIAAGRCVILFSSGFLDCKTEVITAPISWCFHKDYLDNLCKAPVQCLTHHMVFNKCQLYFWKLVLGIQQARLKPGSIQTGSCWEHRAESGF